MDKETKQTVITEYALSGTDTGSTEVQVAVLSARIRELTEHLKMHRKDHSTRRGLLRMVNRRRKLLQYLSREDHGRYVDLIGRLGLRR